MEQELETKTKRTRTEASLHLSNNMAQCPVWDSPRHRGLDSICSYQCDNRSRASMAKHTFHVDGDTLYPVLVRIFEQEEPVSAVITMQNGSVFTLLVEASDTIDNDGTITYDAEASDTLDMEAGDTIDDDHDRDIKILDDSIRHMLTEMDTKVRYMTFEFLDDMDDIKVHADDFGSIKNELDSRANKLMYITFEFVDDRKVCMSFKTTAPEVEASSCATDI